MRLSNLLGIDRKVSRTICIVEKPGFLRTFAVILAHSGDSWFWFIGLGLLWYFGTSFWKYRAIFLLKAILITAVVVFIIKLIVRRKRPVGDWGSIYRNTDPHSFPSGHAVRAFMLIVVFWGIGPYWITVILTIWAPMVALARVAMGIHYLSDVIFGGLLGGIIGAVILLTLH